MSKNLQPEIRFKGFSEDWEMNKLGMLMNVTSVKRIHQSDWTSLGIPFLRARDIDWEEKELGEQVEFFSGLTYSPSNIVANGGTLVLRSSNVQNSEIYLNDNVYVDTEVVSSQNVELGDIIVVVRNGSRALIGKHAIIKTIMKDTVIGAFMTGIRYEYSYFVNALLDTQQFTIEINKSLGATINQITLGNFRKMLFFFPDEKEQEKIGNYFKELDKAIALQSEQLDKLKNIKKAYLAKMFV